MLREESAMHIEGSPIVTEESSSLQRASYTYSGSPTTRGPFISTNGSPTTISRRHLPTEAPPVPTEWPPVAITGGGGVLYRAMDLMHTAGFPVP